MEKEKSSINHIVCYHFNFPIRKLRDKTNKEGIHDIISKRQLCIYFHIKYRKVTYADIAGLFFGNRKDHAKVIYSKNAVLKKMFDFEFSHDVHEIEQKILRQGYKLVDRKHFKQKREYI